MEFCELIFTTFQLKQKGFQSIMNKGLSAFFNI